MSARSLSTRRVYAPFDAPTVSQTRCVHFYELGADSIHFTWNFRVHVVHKFPVREGGHGPMLQLIVADQNGMKMEAFCSSNPHRFDRVLAEGSSYEIRSVAVFPNPNEFRYLGKELEIYLTNQTTVHCLSNFMFSNLPASFTAFEEIYVKPNRSIVDIIGLVVDIGPIQHINSFPRRIPMREICLMDKGLNFVMVRVWDGLIAQYLTQWRLAGLDHHVLAIMMLEKSVQYGCLMTMGSTKFIFRPEAIDAQELEELQVEVQHDVYLRNYVRNLINKRNAELAAMFGC